MIDKIAPEAPRCLHSKTGHTWTYTGVRFRDGIYPRPGSSAKTRYYGQHYLCVHCGTTRVHRLPGVETSTYEMIRHGATPATAEEFPIEHEKGAK